MPRPGGHQTRTRLQSLPGETSVTGWSSVTRWCTQLAWVTRICRADSTCDTTATCPLGSRPEHQHAALLRMALAHVTAVGLPPPVGGLAFQPHAGQRAGEGRTLRGDGAPDIAALVGEVAGCPRRTGRQREPAKQQDR